MSIEALNYLKSLANAEIAEHSKKYFKTGPGEYGDGDVFLGIRMPVIRSVAKKFITTSLKDILPLITSNYHEVRLFAVILLVEQYKKADAHKQSLIYDFYLSNTAYVNNWDIVDSSAYHIVGHYLADRPKDVLVQLALSSSLWERRISIISTFYFIKNNQFSDALHICKMLLHDSHDLIHKAVGWMLREIGNRDLKVECDFLDEHYIALPDPMPRTMLRYAIEKFPTELKQNYMAGKR